MAVNQTLASFSDTSYVTAFSIYLLALVVSLFHYVKMQGIIDVQRDRARSTHLTAANSGVDVGDKISVSAGTTVDNVAKPADLDTMLKDREVKASKIAGMAQTLVWLGIITHIAAIVLRGLSASRFPFGNLYEYILVVTACAMTAAAIVFQRHEWRVLWPWFLVPMLSLLFYGGTELYSDSAPVVPALQSYWFPIHISTISVGAAAGMVSGVISLLYLLRMWQPKGKERGFFGAVAKPLPSAKTLDGMAYKTAIVTLPVFGLGVVLGAIWAEAAWGRFWGWDPKETVSFVSWILYGLFTI